MTSSAEAGDASSRADLRPAWLFGPRSDLLLGAGGLYLLSVPLLFGYGAARDVSEWSLIVAAVFTIAINAPHYGATLIRVYDRGEDRSRYRVFATWLSLACLLAFVTSLHVHILGSILLTAYVTWTPWHFAGQNYGVALTFLRRAGVPVDDVAKRLFYLSFLLSALIAILSLHVQGQTANYSAGVETSGAVYEILRAGVPPGIGQPLLGVLAVAYVVCSAGSLIRLARGGSLATLAAPVALMATQALWFAIPAALTIQGVEGGQALAFATIWVSTCHSAQYLWITSHYARRSEAPLGVGRFLWMSMLAGSAITVVPGLLFSPALLGTVSWEAGLAVVLFSAVNLHHFLLDGAVWKLRDGPVARALLRASEPGPGVGPGETGRTSDHRVWGPVLVAVGIVSFAVPTLMSWEILVVFPEAQTERGRLEESAQRLRWIGRDHPLVLDALGQREAEAGNVDAAVRAYRDANEVLPNPQTMNNLAWILATRRADDPESVRDALDLATRASRAFGDREPTVLDTLAAAHAANGEFDEAQRLCIEAIRLARSMGRGAEAEEIRKHLRLYRTGRLVGR